MTKKVDNLTIEEIKKNNELFANSLTFKIVGKQNFIRILLNWWYDSKYVLNYTNVIIKYLKDYENELLNHLEKLDNKQKE